MAANENGAQASVPEAATKEPTTTAGSAVIVATPGVARNVWVGLRVNNLHQVVGYSPNTPLKSPLVQGGTLFSSNVTPQRGMKNSLQFMSS